jgi:hypothetical protein
MNPQDLLTVSAEISIAMLGFAAIASVFRGSQGGVTPDGRFWGMLALAFVGFVSSLAPLPFLAAETSPNQIWGIGSSLLSIFMFVLSAVTVIAVKQANLSAGVSTNIAVLTIFTVFMLATGALAFYNSGFFSSPNFPLYFGTIISIHIITAAVFIRILTVWLRN